MIERIGCSDVCKEFGLEIGCCDSCHDDDDEGYMDLPETDLPDGRLARICCRVLERLDAKLASLKTKTAQNP